MSRRLSGRHVSRSLRSHRRRKLWFEPLEDRRLLAAWSGQHGDIWNTGRADFSVPAERLNDSFFDVFAWQTRVPGSPADGSVSSSTMAFFDGAGPGGADIVVGGYHWPKGVQGMDRHTGAVFWFGNPDGGESIGINTPAFSNNGSVIYVTNDATFPQHPLMAFSTVGGPNAYWHNGSDANPDLIGAFSPKVATDGRIFVNRWADRPYGATDFGNSLSTTWSAETDVHTGLAEFAMFEDAAGLRIVTVGRIGLIKSFDGDGDELWSVSTGIGTDADTTVDPANGNIYVPMGFDDIAVAGLSKNGTPLWDSPVRPVYDWINGTNERQRAQSGGALSHDGATFYFQTESELGNGRLYAINTADGSLKWSFQTNSKGGESNAAASPIVTTNGVIIIGNNLGDTYFAIQDLGTHGELLDSLVVDSAGTARAGATLAPDGLLYLPLRTVQTMGGGSQTPSFQVENLFTAIDITASPTIVLPAPGNQTAIASNHAVALSWLEIPDTASQFKHYAIYRSTSPFTSVAGMTPLATVADIDTTSYVDNTANNGTSYFYAVTSVSVTDSESTDVPSIGPRTPRDETDLQVVSIARPEFPRFNAQYTGYEVTEPSGYGPYFFTASTSLGGGQTFGDQRFPLINDMVPYTATVRNRGTNAFNGNLSATWPLDGTVVGSPMQIVALDAGELVTFQYVLPWDFNPHELSFTINVADSRAANNSLTSDPLAVPFLTYIDQTFVEKFREGYTTNPATQNDDIIDWLNVHMRRFNELFEAAGTQKRVHYGVLEVVPDNTPDPAIDYSPYAIFPLRYRDDEGNPRLSGYYNLADDIDYGLLHEMGHQLGLIDLYQFNLSPEMNLVSGRAYQTVDDLMMNVSPFLTDATALAMEHWLRQAHGYFGQYMYNMPETIKLRILGHDGQPLDGATVKVYQLQERPGIGKAISNQIKFQGSTDANGLFTLPNVDINEALVPPIGTGDVLRDNPFGYLAVVGTNGVFHITVEYDGFIDYAWLDAGEANVAYFQGQTELAVFDRQVSLGGPVQTVPPSDMTELNAEDWEAWAQSANAIVSDDTTRKIAGQSSLKFVTNGGFDTYVRYPGEANARWNLADSDSLNISFYAENPSPFGFQSGSPWIRLYNDDGSYFQYQYHQNGGIADILNQARNTWRSYQIPLDAASTVQNGWRRTTFGSPDMTSVTALEIHSDTWDFGFTLWIDGVSFQLAAILAGDYNRDRSVDAADYVVWRRTLGAAGPSCADGDGDGDGTVDQDDYGVWRANFGTTAPAAARVSVAGGADLGMHAAVAATTSALASSEVPSTPLQVSSGMPGIAEQTSDGAEVDLSVTPKSTIAKSTLRFAGSRLQAAETTSTTSRDAALRAWLSQSFRRAPADGDWESSWRDEKNDRAHSSGRALERAFASLPVHLRIEL